MSDVIRKAEEAKQKASDTLLFLSTMLEEHDDRGGNHFQRVQEFNTVFFWLTKALEDGLPETVNNFYNEVKGVLI